LLLDQYREPSEYNELIKECFQFLKKYLIMGHGFRTIKSLYLSIIILNIQRSIGEFCIPNIPNTVDELIFQKL
jgi:hypothetical protein